MTLYGPLMQQQTLHFLIVIIVNVSLQLWLWMSNKKEAPNKKALWQQRELPALEPNKNMLEETFVDTQNTNIT